MQGRYWTAGNLVATVAFLCVALLPWLWLFDVAEAWKLTVAGLVWLVIGTFAAANSVAWRRR